MKRKEFILGMTVLCLSMAGGCQTAQPDGADTQISAENAQGAGSGADVQTDAAQETEMEQETGADSTGVGSAAQSAEQNGLLQTADKIVDQTFDVELNSLGNVTFASYTARTDAQPNGDAVFAILRGDEVVQMLEGIEKDNVRTDRCLDSVVAVSFPDYNGDGIKDIITVCNYEPLDGDEEKASEIRIYTGNADGSFTLERELSAEADSALTEKTIKSVLGFLGAPDSRTDASENGAADGWQQAYIACISPSDDPVEEYNLIYLNDDEIPELVVIGNCEAAGCRIVSFCDGKIYQNQLNRLYFSYIEGENLLCNSEGNMDCYYDLVYSLGKQGVRAGCRRLLRSGGQFQRAVRCVGRADLLL